MIGQRAVIDTSVFIAALRSRRGASNLILRLALKKRLEIAISVPLVLEYEAVGKKHGPEIGYELNDIDVLIDAICAVAVPVRFDFRWRPILVDPNDEMVLETAIDGHAKYIVTFNIRHFSRSVLFGIQAIPPGEFVRRLGERDA